MSWDSFSNNRAPQYDFHEEDTKDSDVNSVGMISQTLQRITAWERPFSHERLHISLLGETASRREHFEIFPVAVARCFSYSCCVSIRISFAQKVSSDFSFGLVDLDKYSFDFNLADAIGRMKDTWGVFEASPSLYALGREGDIVKRLPPLRSGDVLSLYIDLNSQDSFEGKCYFFINDKVMYCWEGLAVETRYAIAATLPPLYSLEILPDHEVRIDSRFDDIDSPREAEEKDNRLYDDVESKSDDREHRGGIIGQQEISRTEQVESTDRPTPVPVFFPSSRNVISLPRPSNVVSHNAQSADPAVGLECCVCLSANKCVLFLPCKHICVCEDCGIVRVPAISHCPVCRVAIHSRTKVFL